MITTRLLLRVHQPWQLRRYTYFDVGRDHGYFDETEARERVARAAERSYRPVLERVRKLLERRPSFAVAFSVSGPLLAQLRDAAPDVFERLRHLAAAHGDRIRFLADTSHAAAPWVVSPEELADQVVLYARLLRDAVGATPAAPVGKEPLRSAPADPLARDAAIRLAALERRARRTGDGALLEDFRRLTTADHFESMAAPGGDDSPYETYLAFRHAVADLARRLSRGPESEASARRRESWTPRTSPFSNPGA